MRSIFFIVFLLACVNADASVYVVYNTTSKEVLSVSPQDDAVVPSGYSKEVLGGIISDYPLEYKVQDYRFVSKRFVANTAKISEREARIEAALERQEELDMIEKEAKRTAYDALVGAGYKFKHVKETDFQ